MPFYKANKAISYHIVRQISENLQMQNPDCQE